MYRAQNNSGAKQGHVKEPYLSIRKEKTGNYRLQRPSMKENVPPSLQTSPVLIYNTRYQIAQQDDDYDTVSDFDRAELNYKGKEPWMSTGKLRLDHISAVHELIAAARQKKSDIEDLLRSEQTKAESEVLTREQLSKSIRNLKKVVRLMDIVCRLILGRKETIEADNSVQQSLTLSSLNSFSYENYEHELKQKQREINRLNQLVQLLSVPQQNQSTRQQTDSNILISHDVFDVCTHNAITQTQREPDHSQSSNFGITNVYSVWNIIDAEQPRTKAIEANKQSGIKLKLLSEVSSVKVSTVCNFTRRYKSIVKLCLYSMNVALGVMNAPQQYQRQNVDQLAAGVHTFADYFNSNYYISHDSYDDRFGKEVKYKLQKLYERLVQCKID